MAKYIVKTKFIFSGTFEVEADNKKEAKLILNGIII